MVLKLASGCSVPFQLTVSYLKGGLEHYQVFTFTKTFYTQGALTAAVTNLNGSLLVNDSTNIAAGTTATVLSRAASKFESNPS